MSTHAVCMELEFVGASAVPNSTDACTFLEMHSRITLCSAGAHTLWNLFRHTQLVVMHSPDLYPSATALDMNSLLCRSPLFVILHII